MTGDVWTGCYQGNYNLISDSSFSHPAKMAAGLCYRIIEHLEELGLLKDGMTIFDPMSGTGMTALCALSKGYKAITIELEERFVGFQNDNKARLSAKLHKELDWTIVQGDSRHLADLLVERGLVTLVSPPYEHDGEPHRVQPMEEWRGGHKWGGPNSVVRAQGYGHSPGQVGNLRDKPVTIVSPPYENSLERGSRHQHKDPKLQALGGYAVGNETAGNVGSEAGESYLDAMRVIYHQIGLVSNVLAIVTKNPTRAGGLRRLDLDTIALLEQTGWHILCTHKALLFTEHSTVDLFGQTHKKLKGRMSFFKRLSYRKGHPVAQWEDVIIATREGGGNLVTAMSPPYIETTHHDNDPHDLDGISPGRSARLAASMGDSPGQIGRLK